MGNTRRVIKLIEPKEPAAEAAAAPLARVMLVSIQPDGMLCVRDPRGHESLCECLETGALLSPRLQPGDALLAHPPVDGLPGVVVGRIGRYKEPTALLIESDQSLQLKCGQSSIDLHADGKVMIRGEDVLVRAKGTQRIRAGAVSIN
jgi:hypothetical protein